MPTSTSGQHYLGLPVVDGVTIEVPVLEALQRGMVDVPVILQTMLAEMDTYEGNSTIYSMGGPIPNPNLNSNPPNTHHNAHASLS